MSRPRKTAPDYCYHVSGQAVVNLNGKTFYLGPHDSPESHAKYRALVAEFIASGYQTPAGETHKGETPISVSDVTSEYRELVKVKYASAPKERYRLNSLCTLLELEYGDCVANEFGPRKLTSLRETLIATGNSRK